MKKRLKIFAFGEYRCKKSKNDIVIKEYNTNLVLEVTAGNSLKHELKKEDRLLKHIRKSVDEFASSVRTINIEKSYSDIAMEAGITIEDLENCDRERLVAFINQEELPIDEASYKMKTDLRKAILDYVSTGVATKVNVEEEVIMPNQGDEKRQVMHDDGNTLDDRGLPSDELSVEDIGK